jgi:hypothetical protein
LRWVVEPLLQVVGGERWSRTQCSVPILFLWRRQPVQVGNLDTVAICSSDSECGELHEVNAVHFAPERWESPRAGFAIPIIVASRCTEKVSVAERRRIEPELQNSLLRGVFSDEAKHEVLRLDGLELRYDGLPFWSLDWTHVASQCDAALCADPGLMRASNGSERVTACDGC